MRLQATKPNICLLPPVMPGGVPFTTPYRKRKNPTGQPAGGIPFFTDNARARSARARFRDPPLARRAQRARLRSLVRRCARRAPRVLAWRARLSAVLAEGEPPFPPPFPPWGKGGAGSKAIFRLCGYDERSPFRRSSPPPGTRRRIDTKDQVLYNSGRRHTRTPRFRAPASARRCPGFSPPPGALRGFIQNWNLLYNSGPPLSGAARVLLAAGAPLRVGFCVVRPPAPPARHWAGCEKRIRAPAGARDTARRAPMMRARGVSPAYRRYSFLCPKIAQSPPSCQRAFAVKVSANA